MGEASSNGLTGAWSGRYDYDSHGPGAAFSLWLNDDAGVLSGETMEPNSFASDAGDTLMAAISGGRTGLDVAFTKSYSDVREPPIAYEGMADPDLNRVTGRWHFPSVPWIRGSFMMVRDRRATRSRTRSAETAA